MKKFCFLLVVGFFWGSAYAVEPLPRPVSIQFVAGIEGPSFVRLQNQEDFTVLVKIQPGADSSIFIEPLQLSLRSGQIMNIILSLPSGRHLLDLETTLFNAQGIPFRGPQPHLYQPLLIIEGFPRKVEFEDLFLVFRDRIEGDSDKANIDIGGFIDTSEIGRSAFNSTMLPEGTYVDPFDLPSPLVFAAMPLGQLPDLNDPDIILPSGGDPPQDNGVPLDATVSPSAFLTEPPDIVVGQTRSDLIDQSPLAIVSLDQQPQATPDGLTSTLTVRGNMSLKITDTSFKSAWGWVVRAWQKQRILIFDIWKFLGWAYVAGDGSWQIQFDSSAFQPGKPVRVEYRTGNRFVQVQDASGNIYTWGDDWNLTGAVTNIGSRYADLTVNGNLPAVDRIYVGATDLWVKFFNTGMNALRDKPIEITFPNTLTSGHCIYDKDANGKTVPKYAWSCSQSGDGKIWLIPAHGNATVAQHEIGHSIHSWYWGGSMPPGSGIAHSLTGCYNGGLALTEGFADFLPYWVQFDRTGLNPVAPNLGYNIESPNNGACQTPRGTNETWVSSTFWDMYDYWNDGPGGNQFDSLFYINQAVPVAILLNNKGTNTMPDFLPVVKKGQSAFWQGEFEKLFRLNTMIP